MTQPIAAPAWQPPAPRPPLTPRARSGARLAGILGFLLLSIGFGLFGIPLALLAFGAFFGLIFAALQRSTGDPSLGGFGDFVQRIDPAAWILPLVAVALVGLVVMAAALFLSAGILRSHGVHRPWAVTWAGAGVAIVASWLASAVLTLPFQFVFNAGDLDSSGAVTAVVGSLSFLAGVLSTAVIGWLSWWWMAHALRPVAGFAVGEHAPLDPPQPAR